MSPLLYKYTDFEGARHILADRTLRFSPFYELNDLFEYSPVLDLSLYMPSGGADASVSLESERLTTQADHQSWFNMTKHEFGVLALSWDAANLLLWAHYADAFKGARIGLDPRCEFFAGDGRLKNTGLFDVHYTWRRICVPDVINPIEVALMAVQNKSAVWSYEKEARVVRRLIAPYTVGYPPSLIREVAFGPRIGSENRNALLDELKVKEFQHVRPSQALMSPTDFSLIERDLSAGADGSFWPPAPGP